VSIHRDKPRALPAEFFGLLEKLVRLLVTSNFLWRHLSVLWITMIVAAPAWGVEGRVQQSTLSNGIKVFIQEDHARKVTAIQLWVKVGSADEEDSERGISHLIEHMAFKGTERRGVGEIAAEVESLGGDINAYTSWDETVFHVTVPSRATLKGLDILTDAVFNPVLDPKELKKEKEVVLEEILEGEERPERKASKLLFRTAYTRSPYKYPIIGYKETVEKFTRDDVIAFRKKWYVPENLFFVIVGDVKAKDLLAEVERMTGAIEPRGFFRPPRPSEPVQERIRSALLRDENAKEARLYIAFHIPSLAGVECNALDLGSDILGSRESSRLVRVVKKEKGLVNNISSYALTPRDPGLFLVSATLESKDLEAATRAIMEELSRLRSTAPPAEELERAKVNIESEHLYARETVSGIARSIGGFEADLGDALYEAKYLRLNRSVSESQVSAAARAFLVSPNVTVTVLLPKKDVPDFKIERLVEIIADSAGKRAAATGVAEAKGKTVTRTLPNGIRVVLEPDDSNPVLSFRVACLGGKRYETKETEGITNYIARMLTKGAGTLNEDEISRNIEDMGGRLKGFSGYDSFGLSASFFSRHLDEGLGLLALIYAEPSFPKDKLERERELIINRIKTETDRPVAFAINQLNETIYKRHPYGFDKEGTLETVAGFTREDLRQTYENYAVPANTVITGVGEMDTEKALAKITELFGKLPARPFDPPEIPKEEPITSVEDKVVRIPRAKAHLVIGFRGTTLKDEERYPLEVLNNVLAGQGGRLFLELRDKESLAYTVTSFVRNGMDPGVFAFYIACDASKVDQALSSLHREIEGVRDAQIGEEELKRAINNLIGNHRISLQSTWSRAENTVLNTLYGLGYDYNKEFERKIAEVSAPAVMDAARKFLDPARCVVVKILPEKTKK
jgi:zinc protease